MTGHYLVTGGAGFIGSHLVDRLIAEGHTVTVIDDLSTGRRENLSQAEKSGHVHFLHGKVSTCADLPKITADATAIFHLAAAVGVELVMRSPIETIRTNLDETEVILEAAKGPVLIASTSEVYGKSQKTEFAETDDLLIGPPHLGRWSYACSKLMDEFLALSYHKERQLSVTIARLFNTVGPRQTGSYGMVLPRFIAAAKNNQPLRVYGDGQQTRCFCYVHDTVEALLRLHRVPATAGEIINIGSNEEITIANLAQKVITLLNSNSKIEYIPYDRAYQPGFEDMLRRKPSIEKLARLTQFRPLTTLDQIILSTASI